MRAFLPAKKPFTHLAAPIEGKLFAKLFLEKAEIASPASSSPRVAAGGTHPRPLHLTDKLQFIIYYYDKTDKKQLQKGKEL